jgi:hypothetical protein
VEDEGEREPGGAQRGELEARDHEEHAVHGGKGRAEEHVGPEQQPREGETRLGEGLERAGTPASTLRCATISSDNRSADVTMADRGVRSLQRSLR